MLKNENDEVQNEMQQAVQHMNETYEAREGELAGYVKRLLNFVNKFSGQMCAMNSIMQPIDTLDDMSDEQFCGIEFLIDSLTEETKEICDIYADMNAMRCGGSNVKADSEQK